MRMRFCFILFLTLGRAALPADGLKPGLIGEYFAMDSIVSDFPIVDPELKPTLKRVDPQIAFEFVIGEFYGTKLRERFYVRWSGSLRVAAGGAFTLYTESDDASRVFIDGKLVLDNHGLHRMQEEEGEAELSAGEHRIKVEFIQYSGGGGCKLSWKSQGLEKQIIPADVLFHKGEEEAAEVKTAAASEPPEKGPVEIPEPAENATLEEKVASVLPSKDEDLWLSVGWRRNLQAARAESQLLGRPLFLWIMNGNPLGCT